MLAAYLPPGVTSLIIVLCITSWAFQARQLRSQGLSLRNRDSSSAARVRGERPLYIILVEIVPTMTSLLVASFLGARRVRRRIRGQPAVPRAGQQQRADVGHDALLRAAGAALEAGNAWWALAPGAAVALLGAGFALSELRLRRDRQSCAPAGEKAT